MKPRSLRLRLLILAALSVGVVLTIADLSVATLFANHVQRSFERSLEAQLDRLVALIEVDGTRIRLRLAMPDARFETPAGGIYWQISDPASGQTMTSRSLWDTVLPVPTALPADGSSQSSEIAGPDGERGQMLARQLVFDGKGGTTRNLVVAIAEDLSTVIAANAAFRSDLMRALLLLALVLITVSGLQIQLGLSPLKLIKRGIGAIRTGQATALTGTYPAEVMPLVSEVNELLSTQEHSIRFARERAADLAHGLKTSLTLLNIEAHKLRTAGRDDDAARIEALSADMTATIDHQLRLARLRHRVRGDFRATLLLPTLGKVVAAVRATPEGGDRDWQVGASEDIAVAIDPMDLTELLGIYLENAARWSRNRVLVDVTTRPADLTITIADDGPGLDATQLAALGQRGRRLDESGKGTGIGLAIAREILELNGGAVSYARAALGGLEVQIRLNKAVDPLVRAG